MIDIIKMHGTGNTFFLIDERKSGFILETDKVSLAIKLCGDTTDGVLFVENSDNSDVKMRIFNADGTEPEMCGNGLRCFSRYVLENDKKEQLIVETMYEKYSVAYVKKFFNDMIGIKIVMRNVLNPKHSALDTFNDKHKPYKFDYFTVSNPHIVAFCENTLSEDSLTVIGKDANESKDIFEKGMNVNMIKELTKGKIYVQTYERGVGLTKSCGTGMTSASTYYSIKNNQIGKKIEVFNDGGMIWCTVFKDNGGYEVEFVGNGTYIYKAKLDLNSFELKDIKNDYDEEMNYDKFFKYTREIIKDFE